MICEQEVYFKSEKLNNAILLQNNHISFQNLFQLNNVWQMGWRWNLIKTKKEMNFIMKLNHHHKLLPAIFLHEKPQNIGQSTKSWFKVKLI